jgi:tight adherence protein B
MNATLLVTLAVGIGVAALVGFAALAFRGDSSDEVEDRLSALTAGRRGEGKKKGDGAGISDLLAKAREGTQSPIETFVAQYLNLPLLMEQADVGFTVARFMIIVVALSSVGFALPMVAGFSAALAPLLAGTLGILPIVWLLMRRKRRLNKFASQLPEALELVARALRAGHSLASGFSLVANEMSAPIATEFTRTYEEQNLGKPMEEALEAMTKRVPNLDLKFFATAVILQRQTGGDLAEILDKIGHLIRERFQIWGQVQALTGEGRLSGIVLLALPPALFAAVFKMNPDYLMVLFTDDMGKQMLIGGIVMQVLGALVIRKIVNIRV